MSCMRHEGNVWGEGPTVSKERERERSVPCMKRRKICPIFLGGRECRSWMGRKKELHGKRDEGLASSRMYTEFLREEKREIGSVKGVGCIGFLNKNECVVGEGDKSVMK